MIQARILLPQGTPLARTESVVDTVVEALHVVDEDFSERQDGGKRWIKNVSVLFGINVDAFESGPHLATVSADLLGADQRVGAIDGMLERWRGLVGTPLDGDQPQVYEQRAWRGRQGH